MLRIMAGGAADEATNERQSQGDNGSRPAAICTENVPERSAPNAETARQMSSGQTDCVGGSNPTDSPPSYEQALNDRRLEYAGNSSGCAAHGHAQAQSQSQGQNSQSSQQQRPQRSVWMTEAVSEPATVTTEDTLSMITDRELEETCVRMTLPPMHMSMAITCLVLNFLVPGFGTMLAAAGVFCCTRSSDWSHEKRCGSCSLSLCIGLAQLLLTPFLLIGWVWSILWGFAFVAISQQEYHGPKRNSVGPDDIHNVIAQGPPSYSQLSLRTPPYNSGGSGSPGSPQTNAASTPPVEPPVVEIHSPARSRSNETRENTQPQSRSVHPRAPTTLAPSSDPTPHNVTPQTDRQSPLNESNRSSTVTVADVPSVTSRRGSVTHSQNVEVPSSAIADISQ